MKRCFDFVVAALALLLLSPILVAAAIAVAIETGRPVFFIQQRVGRGGREFGMVKFRSMVKDASKIGPYSTQTDDPRITRVGRFLRRTSIDELPQLFNVLNGDMSLVGPRPDLPVQRALYDSADWETRCRVRPGITGLAQALLRSEATPEQRLALDLQYVREQGIRLDAKILLLTLGRLSARGTN